MLIGYETCYMRVVHSMYFTVILLVKWKDKLICNSYSTYHIYDFVGNSNN